MSKRLTLSSRDAVVEVTTLRKEHLEAPSFWSRTAYIGVDQHCMLHIEDEDKSIVLKPGTSLIEKSLLGHTCYIVNTADLVFSIPFDIRVAKPFGIDRRFKFELRLKANIVNTTRFLKECPQVRTIKGGLHALTDTLHNKLAGPYAIVLENLTESYAIRNVEALFKAQLFDLTRAINDMGLFVQNVQACDFHINGVKVVSQSSSIQTQRPTQAQRPTRGQRPIQAQHSTQAQRSWPSQQSSSAVANADGSDTIRKYSFYK